MSEPSALTVDERLNTISNLAREIRIALKDEILTRRINETAIREETLEAFLMDAEQSLGCALQKLPSD